MHVVLLSPVHTGNKDEFNSVDFVESATVQAERNGNKVCCRFNKVDCAVFNFVASVYRA